MRYKAVCEELWKNRVDDLSACCIVHGEEKQLARDSRPSLKHGRKMRGMRANNKNKRPRSEAREHMGLRIYRRSTGRRSRAFEGAGV